MFFLICARRIILYFSVCFQPGSPVSRVLQFSDIHLDFLYQEGSNPYCGEPLCCRSNDKPPGVFFFKC